jgi:type VI secretion system secreted protein VgrG
MQFASVLDRDILLIQTLEGIEGISRLFDFQIELLAESGTEIDPVKLVGTKATIGVALLDSMETKYINGFIAAFEQTSGDDTFDSYQAHIVPSLWQLTLSTNCRVFQDKTPMDIIKAVIEPYKLSISDRTSSAAGVLDYCTQYNESDFSFISRIAEQFGIFYWFEYTNGDNTVVFGNSRDGYDADSQELDYAPQTSDHQELYQVVVSDIRATAVMVTGKHSYRDYDPHARAAFSGGPVDSAQAPGKNAFERYEFPGAGTSSVKKLSKDSTRQKDSHNDDILAVQRDASDVAFNTFHGVSTSRSMFAGGSFSLNRHPRDAWNREYLLTEVAHHAVQTPAYTGNTTTGVPYTVRFAAIEGDRLFRPVARTPKPRIAGPQSGIVVTPSGEDMYVDAQGRVCVQFFWDRTRKPNTIDNTWVRVAQPWAGSGWGTFFWPRKNDEVLIQFLNGDPDAPIVIGSLYNHVNMPKHALPDESTKTGILTRSVKGGTAANANELWFEDKKGSEQIYIHAEKDMTTSVEKANTRNVGTSETITVGASRSLTVDATQTTLIKKNHFTVVEADSNHTIKGNQKQKISGDTDITHDSKLTQKVSADYSMTIGGNRHEKVGSVYVVESGQEVHLKGGMTVVIESGMNLCLKGAGGFISIDPAGVTIQGTMVLINSGGSPVSGTSVSVTDPEDPEDAGDSGDE